MNLIRPRARELVIKMIKIERKVFQYFWFAVVSRYAWQMYHGHFHHVTWVDHNAGLYSGQYALHIRKIYCQENFDCYLYKLTTVLCSTLVT